MSVLEIRLERANGLVSWHVQVQYKYCVRQTDACVCLPSIFKDESERSRRRDGETGASRMCKYKYIVVYCVAKVVGCGKGT